MKKLLLIITISFLSMASSPANEKNDNFGMAIAMTAGAASWAVFTVYSPAIALGSAGLLSTSIGGLMSSENHLKEIKEAVASDVQDFFQTGMASISLVQVIEHIKSENSNLSDIEAVDLILNIINE